MQFTNPNLSEAKAWLISKFPHLREFYNTDAEFEEHLISGEVTVPFEDVIKYLAEYKKLFSNVNQLSVDWDIPKNDPFKVYSSDKLREMGIAGCGEEVFRGVDPNVPFCIPVDGCRFPIAELIINGVSYRVSPDEQGNIVLPQEVADWIKGNNENADGRC